MSGRVFYGGLLGLLSFACFAVMQAGAKVLVPTYDPMELVFWRHTIGLVCLVGYVVLRRRYALLKTGRPVWMGVRALIGTACLCAIFAANIYQPLTHTTVLLFTSALLTPLLAAISLKEPIGLWRWLAIGTGYLGVLLMAGVSLQSGSMAGLILGLTAAGLQSGVGISLRFLGKTESAFTTTFYFILFGALAGGFWTVFYGHIPVQEDMGPLFLMAFSGLAGQLLISEAFRLAPPAVVSPMGYSNLVWTTLLDLGIWGVHPDGQVLVGGVVIMASTALILWREHQSGKRRKNAGTHDGKEQGHGEGKQAA